MSSFASPDGVDLDMLPEPVAMFVREATLRLSDRLDQFGVILPDSGIPDLIYEWVQESCPEGEELTGFVETMTPEEVASEIAVHLLAQIAEERPGTDPFEHDRNIPLPLPVAARLINSMSVCSEIALLNEDYDRLHGLVAAGCSLSEILTEALVNGSTVNEPVELVHNGQELEFPGPLVMYPQPGLAYCARMIGATAENLEDGSYAAVSEDSEQHERFIHALLSDATGIRLFTQNFGVNPNPTDGS